MAQDVANPWMLLARAPIGAPPNEYYGIQDHILTATHFGTMFVHARTGKLSFVVEKVQAVISYERSLPQLLCNRSVRSGARRT